MACNMGLFWKKTSDMRPLSLLRSLSLGSISLSLLLWFLSNILLSIFLWCLSCRTQVIATTTLKTNILSGQSNKSHMFQNCTLFFSFRLISAMCRPVLLSLNILDPPAVHTVQFRPITSIMCLSLNIYHNKCSAIFWHRWHQMCSIQN